MNILVVLSGGLDSTVAMRMAVRQHGAGNVSAISFDYGQLQHIELEYARQAASLSKIDHKIIKLDFFPSIVGSYSANLDASVELPTLTEVLQSKNPVTYVPNRNMMLLSIAASYAEVIGVSNIWTGIRHSAPYHDTTDEFIEALNKLLSFNPTIQIKVINPLTGLSKADVLRTLSYVDGSYEFAKYSFSCYRPIDGKACGKCPVCEDRLNAFRQINQKDPIEYADNI